MMFGVLIRVFTFAAILFPLLFSNLALSGTVEPGKMPKDAVEVNADIEGGRRTKRRKSASHYNVNLSWVDTEGKTRSATGIEIPRTLAQRIVVNDTFVADTISIVYWPNEPHRRPVVAETIVNGGVDPASDGQLAVIGVFLAALVGTAIYQLRKRRKSAVA